MMGAELVNLADKDLVQEAPRKSGQPFTPAETRFAGSLGLRPEVFNAESVGASNP